MLNETYIKDARINGTAFCRAIEIIRNSALGFSFRDEAQGRQQGNYLGITHKL